MHNFVIVETADGLSIIELSPGQSPDDAASACNGMLVNEDVYTSYEDAQDALAAFPLEEESDAD
jgi:hypothetical protein